MVNRDSHANRGVTASAMAMRMRIPRQHRTAEDGERPGGKERRDLERLLSPQHLDGTRDEGGGPDRRDQMAVDLVDRPDRDAFLDRRDGAHDERGDEQDGGDRPGDLNQAPVGQEHPEGEQVRVGEVEGAGADVHEVVGDGDEGVDRAGRESGPDGRHEWPSSSFPRSNGVLRRMCRCAPLGKGKLTGLSRQAAQGLRNRTHGSFGTPSGAEQLVGNART